MPVIKIPKDRCKKDTSIHMWTSNSNPADKQLMLLSQQDPEPIDLEIMTHAEDDWLDTAQEMEETEKDPSEYFEHEPETAYNNEEELTNKFMYAIKVNRGGSSSQEDSTHNNDRN